jgi:glycosyltransferase involved in cell wall biosynthesis
MKPRILQVIDQTGPGGAQVVVEYLMRALGSEFTFGVAVLGAPGQYSDAYGALAIPVYELGGRLERWNPWPVRGLIDLVRRERYELIHAHLFKSYVLGTIAAMRTATKAILHEHWGVNVRSLKVLPYFSSAALRHGYVGLYRYVLRHCDRVIALTPQMLQSYTDYYSVEPARITVLPNAVDVSRFNRPVDCHGAASVRAEMGLPQETRLVLMVGRLHPQKDLWTFLQVAEQVEQRVNLPTAFLVAGSGSEEPVLRRHARAHELDHVFFLGHRNDVPKLLHQADVFLLTSRYEALPVAVLEAMAAGCPVVATRSGGPEYVVTDGVDGLLAQVGDVQCLASQVTRLLHDDALHQRLARRAQQTVLDHYSLEAVSARMADIYREVLAS